MGVELTEKEVMPPKITKFIDPSKPKNATKKPTPEKTSLNINTISKKQPSDYTQKYLEKRKEIESGMKKDHRSRGPRSKKELAKVQIDIHKVSLEAHSKEEQRRIEQERLIKLGAKPPKQHKNYKELQLDKKQKEAEFQESLKQMSESEARLIQRKESALKKKMKLKKEKGENYFL